MKTRKWIIPAAILLVVIIAAVLIIVLNKPETEVYNSSEDVNIELDSSVKGISVESVDIISGMFVEDGSDEILSDILTVTFHNDSNKTLQYAKLTLTVDGEKYRFEISTVPSGESVRAMEISKKYAELDGVDATLSAEGIAWFAEEPSMCEDAVKITPKEGSVVLENISDETINAPMYVYYKNYTDGTYIGGITYRVGTREALAPGKSVVLDAGHLDPDASKLMFVNYVP